MKPSQQAAYEILSDHVGQQVIETEWVEITQAHIDQFAVLSGDDQWIHVDPERAASSRFGTTIAHGNLTLAMMGHLPIAEERLQKNFPGQQMGLNYGYDRVRFPHPLKTGSRIRARTTLLSVTEKGDMLETKFEVTADIEGEAKPACVAERIRRLVF